jgi:O-antigen biosynthesis protein
VRSIADRVQAGVRACAGHPAVLCYAIGNEIPAPIVRWHGRRPIERFLASLYQRAKAEDPNALVTYVNYPGTEYLSLPFLDLFCFNVYLEHPQPFNAYLARLHNLAGDRPVILAEIGLDSHRHGLAAQAHTLDWQLRTLFTAGAAGAFVFSWTDDWYRGGQEIADWSFGLTTRDRQPKPALATVRKAFTSVPFPLPNPCPAVSVVVCTRNGSRTLHECLARLQQLAYPTYEIIVVDDGSQDDSASIAAQYDVRLISTPNQGLSAARNTGFRAARGEIIAYLDDDAYPDPHWLHYLAATFTTTRHAAVGGPNIPPPGDGFVADCVANAPGGPVHVLLNDLEAEHIPGCNMSFRRECLESLGGFDPQFRTAGDDVDVCWRILQQGWTIGFNAAAVVWHHRRNSIRNYWRQQHGYGKAEALLERKWPEKYNTLGHIQWSGQMYGSGLTNVLFKTQHVYHGPWGLAPFQALHERPPYLLAVLPTVPEWYLVIIALAALSALALLWPKLALALPFLLLASGATLWQAILSSSRASFTHPYHPGPLRPLQYLLTCALHLAQPLARLSGRARHGLTLWRWRLPRVLLMPHPRTTSVWSESWHPPETKLNEIVAALRNNGTPLLLGGTYDRWDLEVRGGTLGAARLFMTVEEHGRGQQLFRFRYWPRCSSSATAAVLFFLILSIGAAIDQHWIAHTILLLTTLLIGTRTLIETAGAMAAIQGVLAPPIPATQTAATIHRRSRASHPSPLTAAASAPSQTPP